MSADESALLEVLDFAGGEGVLLGPGDDAAVIASPGREIVAAVDTMVEDVHVDLEFSTLADLGFKALAVNVSDLAAMAARPVAALVSLQRPGWFSTGDARRLQAGLQAAADAHACPVVGGDVVNSPTLAVAVSVLGVPAAQGFWLTRSGALPGQLVVVVGALGRAAAGLALWRAGALELLEAHPELSSAHRRPGALSAAVPTLAGVRPSAGIDVSDGLGRDLARIAASSEVAVELEAASLPVDAGVRAAARHLGGDPLDLVVGGGDDYALALSVAPERLERLEGGLADAGLPTRVVGEVVEGRGVWLDGSEVSTLGWEHAASEEPRDD